MQNNSKPINEFIQKLDHPNQPLILDIRKLILNLNKGISENIKWNAPNYSFNGEDRITFNFPPKKNSIRLILHFGARKKVDAKALFNGQEPKIFSWLSADRAMLTFENIKDFTLHYDEVKLILNHWLKIS